MRIAVGQIWQETNTFNPIPTTRKDFEAIGIHRGADVVKAMARINELGGFIQSLRAWPEQPEVVGLVRIGAWPSGIATRETFAWLREEALTAMRAALPVDGVLLALHGAMVAEQHPDAEGDIVAAIRELIGPQVPLVVTLDLHANVTEQLVRTADVILTYHCLPHIDTFSTGERGARALRRLLIDRVRPTVAYRKIPAVVPAENSNTEAPSGVAADLKRELLKLEADPRVLSAGLTPVQPWLDIPEMGSAVIITTADNPQLAQEACDRLAETFWQRRREYLPPLVDLEESVELARQQVDRGLVVLSDAADATTSGSTGDSVWLLEALSRHRWPRPVLVPLVDPELIEQAREAGVGQRLQARIGGKRDTRFGKSIVWEAEVERLFDAKFVMSGHIGTDLPIDMGPSAVLRQGDVHLLVTPRSGPHFAPEFFRSGGFEPYEAAVVVAKSPCGFRAVYQKQAFAIYSVRAPGCAPTEFWKYPFQNIPHPLWPWDEFESHA